MKIKEITYEYILFDNGTKITFDHVQDCCECNYADFLQLKDTDIEQEKFSEPLIFEEIRNFGFIFGNLGKMYFVPCYSEQNGYYTSEVDIYYDGKQVLTLDGKFIEI